MTPADITPTAANCLQTLPCWKTVDLDQSGDNSDFLIANNCREILSKQEVLNTPIPEAMSRFKLFPKKVSAGHNKLMIMMDTNIDQLDREHLECKLCLEDYHYTIEDAKWIKDDILQVEGAGGDAEYDGGRVARSDDDTTGLLQSSSED